MDEVNKLKEEIQGVRTLLNARENEIEKLKCENSRLTENQDFHSGKNIELQIQVSKLKQTIKNIAELI